MSINIHCPHCNQGYTVSENMIGRSIICKKCNNMITVEDVKEYDNVEVVNDESEAPQQQYQQPQQAQYNQPQMNQQQYQQPQGQYPPPQGYPQGQQPNQYGQYPPQQGYQQYAPMNQPVHVPNNLVWAILSLIFCFWPTGIPAVVYAAKVDSRVARGDIYGAQEAAAKSRKWAWISFGIWLFLFVLYMIIIFAVGTSAMNSYPAY